MGSILNKGAGMFRQARNSQIYVDKSQIIAELNKLIFTEQKFVCQSRPRRFGKSMAANMISAYYDRTCHAQIEFDGLKICQEDSFLKFANQFDVIFITMNQYINSDNIDNALAELSEDILYELIQLYPDIKLRNPRHLSKSMDDIYRQTQRHFIIIIDEWDSVMREYHINADMQRKYLDWLREWLKDREYIALVYMTGILPIKKYGAHSALNMFDEYSMLDAAGFSPFVGFTETDVKELCQKYQSNFDEMKKWYDGYQLAEGTTVYNPKSVVSCIQRKRFGSYWSQTETYEALRVYIDMNYEGLRDSIIRMMSHEGVYTDIRLFANDMTTLHTADDIRTLLIHLGYLSYHSERGETFIPNLEIQAEFSSSVKMSNWGVVTKAVADSHLTLEAIWRKDAEAVAKAIETSHLETSHIQYNDENALAYTLSLALYAGRQFYTIVREMPAGKGFADLVLMPYAKYADKPAIIIELKWNQDAETGLTQIINKQYPCVFEHYEGEILIVAVSYDKKTRKHQCKILKHDKIS